MREYHSKGFGRAGAPYIVQNLPGRLRCFQVLGAPSPRVFLPTSRLPRSVCCSVRGRSFLEGRLGAVCGLAPRNKAVVQAKKRTLASIWTVPQKPCMVVPPFIMTLDLSACAMGVSPLRRRVHMQNGRDRVRRRLITWLSIDGRVLRSPLGCVVIVSLRISCAFPPRPSVVALLLSLDCRQGSALATDRCAFNLCADRSHCRSIHDVADPRRSGVAGRMPKFRLGEASPAQ